MAGTDPRFDATEFRDAIRFAMSMGLPTDTSERVTFRWNTDQTFDQSDGGGKPFDWTDSPTVETTYDDIQVDAAVELLSAAVASETTVGTFDTPVVKVTLLDEEQETVMAYGPKPDLVVLDGDEYDVKFLVPPIGLFEVTVYQWYAEARSES